MVVCDGRGVRAGPYYLVEIGSANGTCTIEKDQKFRGKGIGYCRRSRYSMYTCKFNMLVDVMLISCCRDGRLRVRFTVDAKELRSAEKGEAHAISWRNAWRVLGKVRSPVAKESACALSRSTRTTARSMRKS